MERDDTLGAECLENLHVRYCEGACLPAQARRSAGVRLYLSRRFGQTLAGLQGSTYLDKKTLGNIVPAGGYPGNLFHKFPGYPGCTAHS